MTNAFDAVIAAFENQHPVAMVGGSFAMFTIAAYLICKVGFRDIHLGKYAMISLTACFISLVWVALTYEPPIGDLEPTCEKCPEMIGRYESFRNPFLHRAIKNLGSDHAAVLELRAAPTGADLSRLSTEEQVQAEIDEWVAFMQETLRDYNLNY